MVNCVCGKPLEKVPDWMAGVNVQFVCNDCPNRTIKGITQVQIELPKEPAAESEEMTFDEDADEDDD